MLGDHHRCTGAWRRCHEPFGDVESLPVLARILAALDLELRITVADYDAHDDILDDDVARLTAAQRHVLTGTQDEHEGGICGEDVWV